MVSASERRGPTANGAPRGDDALPRRFGDYQLFAEIGRGGMATIYLARLEGELGAERLVVVKQIHAALSLDATFAAQFIDEARLSSGLRHANIAQVVDLGRGPASGGDPGVLFMAMEYVEGLDLQKLLRGLAKKKVPLPPQFVFHIAREALVGLDFAHRALSERGEPLGIVHRDVSPSNLLLSFEGEVKLCDFGIARAYGRAEEMSADASGTRAAVASSEDAAPRVVGKSAYMSPEQARGEELDARADVFSLGIILYEMCAGRRLYRGNEREMLEQARRAEIPPLPDRGIPGHDALAALLGRALAKERSERFESAKAMLDALDAYLMANRLMSSQLRFASFLTEHFEEETLEERRRRELETKSDDAASAPVEQPSAMTVEAPPREAPPHEAPRAASAERELTKPSGGRLALVLLLALFVVGALLYFFALR